MDRTYTWDELLAAVRRRWKVMAIVAGGVMAVAAVVIARIPNEYQARALVMIEPLNPHFELVVPVLGSGTLEEKVKSVRAQVYSRSLMATAIEELNLYEKDRKRLGMDAGIEALRTATEVHNEGDNAFAIVVRMDNAETAAKVSNRLAELFIETNLQVRAGQVTRTRDIISAKLEELRNQLTGAEKRLSGYKREHKDELPELLETRLHERDAFNKQIELEDHFVKDAQRRLDLLGTQPFGKDTEVGRLEEEYDAMRARVGASQSQLTPDHPDLQRLHREAQATFGRLQAARARAAANDLEQRRMTEAVARGQRRIADLQARIAQLDKAIAGTPLVNAQLSELTRDVDLFRAKVGSLISKKAEVEIAADLEVKSGPSEFRVLESAHPSKMPASPNRQQAMLLAFLAALALGGAAAVGKEMSDRSLRTESEAGSAVALPVLACVPQLAVAQRPVRMLTVHPGTEA